MRRFRTEGTNRDAVAAISVVNPVTSRMELTPKCIASGPAATIPRGAMPKDPKVS